MNSITKWELWQRRAAIVWWCFGVVALISLTLAFYPSFRDQAQQLSSAFNNIPDSVMALISDTADLFSPVGYLSSQVFYLVLPLLLSVLAISLGSSLLAKEEKSGTIELLLSRPVSRARLIAGKALAGVLTLVAVSSAATLTTIVAAKLVDLKVGSLQILLANAAACLLALSFGAIAFLLTSLGRARAASLGVATAFAMGGYIIASLQGAADWLKWPAKIFPFNYYRPAEIFKSSYSWIHLLFIVGVIVVCGCLSYISFKRRDITS